MCVCRAARRDKRVQYMAKRKRKSKINEFVFNNPFFNRKRSNALRPNLEPTPPQPPHSSTAPKPIPAPPPTTSATNRPHPRARYVTQMSAELGSSGSAWMSAMGGDPYSHQHDQIFVPKAFTELPKHKRIQFDCLHAYIPIHLTDRGKTMAKRKRPQRTLTGEVLGRTG